MAELTDLRGAVLATDGFGEIQGVRHDLDKTARVKVDRTIRHVSAEQFDAVQVQDCLRAMQDTGKPFAAICHP